MYYSRWTEELGKSQVLVMTYSIFLEVIHKNFLKMNKLNLLILDDCHNVMNNEALKGVLTLYENAASSVHPRILGLTASIVNNICKPMELSQLITILETKLKSVISTSNNVLSALQHSTRPKELICEISSKYEATELQQEIMGRILLLNDYLRDHRYDPAEYYGEQDYLKEIPNPCHEPLDLLEEYIQIIQNFGPWGADRAALVYLIHLEKLKTKAVYERHYLLLCLVFTVLLEIRSLCEEEFQKYSEYERIVKFSHPKVLRLLDILRIYRPPIPSVLPTSAELVEVSDSLVSSEGQTVQTPKLATETSQTAELIENGPAILRQSTTQPGHTSRRRRPDFSNRHHRNREDAYQLCGMIFTERRTTAKLLYHLLKDASRCDPQLAYLSPLYTVDRMEGVSVKEMENEERKQEDVMKRFRSRDCNILVATSVLEDGIDVPACHLVIRYDLPQSYRAYVHSKARARAKKAHYILMVENERMDEFLVDLSHFHATEQILLSKSGYHNSVAEFFNHNEDMLNCIQAPYPSDETSNSYASLQNAISIINRYCAKLPSDCFTRLTPVWRIQNVFLDVAYICSLQLPINSPLRKTVLSQPMPSKVTAKRSAALEACRLLHQKKELDDHFYPTGKENLRLEEEEDYNADLEEENVPENLPRPGTTKRRQYYYKQVADPFINGIPRPDQPCYLYAITMVLSEPIPEEQNTRGRKIYKPETSIQSLGILNSKPLSQICPFPIFTRSGEVEVEIVKISDAIRVTEGQLKQISDFQRYIFRNVLSLEKDPMLLDVYNADCSYLIVPLRRSSFSEHSKLSLDFVFIDLISSVRDSKPQLIAEEVRSGYVFDPRLFSDAVVMKWYRDQEHPQCFYVAEIFYELNPQSKFPDNNYPTFEKYYRHKYGIQIQNLKQPLLDVDHTSARLNFLTPRYVNRKGVMLPTSSEHTKKTQRESLQQKQILVPELCSIHPFSASLWRQAVCLPCILYRLNGLLLAEQLRCKVATEISLGRSQLEPGFCWPALRFDWKCKSSDPALPPLQRESIAKKVEDTKLKVCPEENDASKSSSKVPKREIKEGKKSAGASLLDIGVWNPDAINGSNNQSDNGSYNSGQSANDSDTDDVSEEDESGCKVKEFGPKFVCRGDTAEAIEEPINLKARKFKSPEEEELEEELTEDDEPYENIEDLLSMKMQWNVDIPNRDLEVKCENLLILHKALIVDQSDDTGLVITELTVPGLDFPFSFDEQQGLESHPGPSPSVILQAFTMSSANDGINLERLETIGDSFLKYAITTYLYCKYSSIHEGELSHLRSRQVSNLHLYQLGKKKLFGGCMVATKFNPHENWLPPGYVIPDALEEALISSGIPLNYWNVVDLQGMEHMSSEQVKALVQEKSEQIMLRFGGKIPSVEEVAMDGNIFHAQDLPRFVPYNLLTQHSIPDKSIADCVEALIGAYLRACGPRGALLFMSWLGLKVLPVINEGSYGYWTPPISPLVDQPLDIHVELDRMLAGFESFEEKICYKFNDRSYLLQAFSHASYYLNRLTDCYQRLEFLGDAVLDYLITRYLYENLPRHPPGALTDLRSALVNNTTFAVLAERYEFHRYFKHLSPSLNQIMDKFIKAQEENGHSINEEYYMIEAEDVEVPKVLGDVFESVAGAIYLDSHMSLNAVWRVYYNMMKKEIDEFSKNVPKSPIRELLELETDRVKFGKAERLPDGRLRVTVDVIGKGTFKGIGRNYRIAKCTAAKYALRTLEKRKMLTKRGEQ
ncbi:hypothetical protein DAPPUDRAFT_308316 [Daphnia pulex]|uniref:ribonuclease III n=1 Tax=Daphnia pulex TaxID=6669 RepID=E9H7E4_DAPPU|nr:hypothetical protein DAPPUDRAFT_308316 [Daphnia pulex]|eukprot:EFX72380.1 hypothetical protein DAPPUDRAFT_308316 [Daphnia pulex]